MWAKVKVFGLGVVVLSISAELLGRLLRRLRPGRRTSEVLFFPTELACVEDVFTPSPRYSCCCSLPHGLETSFSRLLRHLLSASSTLDLCVFAFSNMDLCRAVLALHSRNVTIRVITDKNYAAITGSQIGVLRKAGICIRSDVGSVYMHHKFAVMDGRLLITGSLNWTLTAVQSNMENILITEDPDLVQPFVAEFQRLWVKNDPARYYPSNDQKPAHVTTRINDK